LTAESQRSEALARFHRALVEEIARSRPAYLREPFTVAEIYQNLVPYRTHRDRIGVEMNGDYEDALLRLLAGEGEYLLLESDHAKSEIAEELSSPNPNTGLYREFAAVDVRLNPLRMPHDLADAQRASAPGQDGSAAPGATHGGPAAPKSGPTPSAPAPAVPPATSSAKRPAGCPWCREQLPQRGNLNYCPFCGANLQTAPCPNCGEELEEGWRFCAACGTSIGEAD
jgi:hypothetical protein